MGVRVSLSYDEIAEIVKIIDGSSCDEVIVETADIKTYRAAEYRRRRRRAVAGHSPSDRANSRGAGTRVTPPPAAVPAKTAIAPHQIEVVAPMVGTFYCAPSPDAAAFVEIGSIVRKGDPLCLIEVMKLFTTIAAEHDGRIVAIGAENAELVEYGRMLFVIEPA